MPQKPRWIRDHPKRNRLLRDALAPVRWMLGRRLFERLFRPRLPVLGKVKIRLPEGQRIALHAGVNDEIATELYYKGYEGYEKATAEVFRRLAKRSKVILDIGANTGYFALMAARINPEAHVYAFEPVERVYKLLVNNRKRNGLRNLTAIMAAVADFDGGIDLYVPRGETPSSASTREGFRRRSVTRVPVPALKIDSYARRKNLERIDLAKIDTESTEPAALRGMSEILGRDSPIVICEVLNGRTEEDLMKFLPRFGYRYYHITDKGLEPRDEIVGDITYRFSNYLFSRTKVDLG